MLEIQRLCKRFGKFEALKSITAVFEKGETIALIGPNGSGKTTLIKSILGLVIPDSGDVLLSGESVLGKSVYRNLLGYMPQIGRYPENMTIKQVFDMVISLRQFSRTQIDDSLIEELGIAKLFGKKMGTLSGGTRQKVSACLAFMFSPEIIILDEPTAGLDPVASEILKRRILHEKNLGKLTIVTSHVLSDLDDLVSSIVYMQDGIIKIQEPIEVLQQKTGLQKLNQVMANIILSQNCS